MNNKNKIYDCAYDVVNSDKPIVFNDIVGFIRVDTIEYKLADATNEYFATDEGKADLLLLVQGKINLNDIKEPLKDHVVKEFTKLINDGYTMEVKQ